MSEETFFAKQKELAMSFEKLGRSLQELTDIQSDHGFAAIQRKQEAALAPFSSGLFNKVPSFKDWSDYLVDFSQRMVLYWDTLRQRADNMIADEQNGYPWVLKFDYEILVDGKDLPDPVNYCLLRILPDPGQKIDNTRQPIVIVDPRGGHGSGIGGFKKSSEIGESLRAGHPTYFIAFRNAPEPGQTIITAGKAQAYFLEQVIARHPKSPKPVIIGNCQAGWAVMGLAASRPDLESLVIINGAPLSYWAGVKGQNPMRYAAGLMGGAWMTRFGSDIGNGIFDGAWLVINFENLNPANTWWSKDYNLFSKVDTEAPRYLDFERWWCAPTLFNSEEIESIVDELFIGNRLTGGVSGRAGSPLNLRNIKCPVVVFCSSGDNITPPQQALNWVVDLYPNDMLLRASGRTIVYLKHASVGHLGIFVSGRVAEREHRELINAIDSIKALPPGLFELVIDDVQQSDGKEKIYQVHYEKRSIKDLISADQDGRTDEAEFELVDRLSEINSTLYDWCVRPWLSNSVNELSARLFREFFYFRSNRRMWSSTNPVLWWLPGMAQQVKASRAPAHPDNPLLGWQEATSDNIEASLDAYRATRDSIVETIFHLMYGTLNAITGEGTAAQKSPIDIEAVSHDLVEKLEGLLTQGGTREAVIRIILLLTQSKDKLDQRVLDAAVNFCRQQGESVSPQEWDMLRETIKVQNLLVFTYPKDSLKTLPALLRTKADRQDVIAFIKASAQFPPADSVDKMRPMWQKILEVLELPVSRTEKLAHTSDTPKPVAANRAPAAASEKKTAVPQQTSFLPAATEVVKPKVPATAAPAKAAPPAKATATPVVAKPSQPKVKPVAKKVAQPKAVVTSKAKTPVKAAGKPAAKSVAASVTGKKNASTPKRTESPKLPVKAVPQKQTLRTPQKTTRKKG